MGPSLPAAALALLSLFAVGSCRDAQFDAENFNTSDATRYYGGWVSARATWYGQPNGAGPDDNGERLGTSCIFFSRSLSFSSTPASVFRRSGQCGSSPPS
jgi:hypothetical protein